MSELAERLRRLSGQAGARFEPTPTAGSAEAAPERRVPAASDAASSIRTTPAAGLKALLRRHLRAGQTTTPGVSDQRRDGGGFGRAGDFGLPSVQRDLLEPAHGGDARQDRAAASAAWAGSEISPGLFEHIERLALEPPPEWQWLPDLHPQLLPSDRLLHFDTETTGLAGGTGTRAFMLGFARWHAAGLELRQLWISRLGAEAAMLERFAQWLAEEAFQLVSYNGRSFDAPLLRARYRLCRQRDPLAGLPHHDLLPAVRRRFRGVWPSCRLAEAETRLLGVARSDDLPGAEVPAAFLASLRSGDPRPLERVRRHHRQDLISLAALLPCLIGLSAQAPQDWALVRSPGACERPAGA
jgi:uncharacterized protein YprB with RNaseH-like and TPR domain